MASNSWNRTGSATMLHLLLSMFMSAFGLLQLLLAAAVVVDILRTDRPWVWAMLAFFFPLLGPLIYFVNFYVVDSFGWRRFDTVIKRGRRLRQLRELSKIQDTAALHGELGELLFEKGDHAAALGSLERALDLAPETLRAHYFAGRALLVLGRADGAVAHLEYVVDEDPKFLYGEAILALSRALAAAGRRDEAFAMCERALALSSIPEVVYQHAAMLCERGEKERARAALERMVREANAFPHFQPVRDRRWIREARKALRRM